jgi:hypothetical protein
LIGDPPLLKGTENFEPGDFLKVAKVAGEDRVALLEHSRGDHQIGPNTTAGLKTGLQQP